MSANPEWLSNAIFYEIYPQSFCDSNGDGIGDFKGIISKLDYIKDLGCNALWINPCFDSPFGDAGYDVSDYRKIDPRFGTMDDFEAFVKKAKSLMVISWVYVFSLLVALTLAIEIGQKVTGSGDMDFADIIRQNKEIYVTAGISPNDLENINFLLIILMMF